MAYSKAMNTTPAQAAFLTILEQIVDRQIKERHRLVCGMSDARKAIASLRTVRQLYAKGCSA